MVAGPPFGSFGEDNGEEDDLIFLRDEGFELLALFKSITDKRKRDILRDLVRMVAEEYQQPRSSSRNPY